jgi:uncharacterized delta-60 repeat protein
MKTTKGNLGIKPTLQPGAGAGLAAPWLSSCLLGILLLSGALAQGETATEAWVRRYSSEGVASTDQAKAVVVDSAGNVIVAGYIDDGITGADWLVIKYSNGGTPLWTNRYNGPANDSDYPNAVAVDAGGNVFVTGSSTSSGGKLDFATIKYSGAGAPLWTNRYAGPGNGSDQANAVAVDASGNVVVTGSSPGSGGDYDYATIKYSGAGVPLWTNRYNGPGNGSDYANAVAVDASGNAFVTGASTGSGSNYDYATIQYSGAGLPLWTNRYNGPANSDDYANAVVVDTSGNVFVTGNSLGNGGFFDYATIKYSGAGVPLWTNRYNGPADTDDQAYAAAVDPGGNVFVTGASTRSGGNYDYATIAYSGAGLPLWTNRYNGPANSDDTASAVAADASGNVFVTGYSGGSGGDSYYATIGYSGAGVPLWTNRYIGPANGYNQANAVAVDASGNVFVTGYSYHGGANDEFATIAYSGAGAPLWTNRYNGPGNGANQAYAVAVDASGNVFVTGSSDGSGGGSDYVTIGYSSAGAPLWTNRYKGPGDYNGAKAVAVDTSGNVFVTGISRGSGVYNDYATIKYSGAGVPLWTNRFNGTAGGDDWAVAVAVDASGNVFVTGYSATTLSGDYDYATIKYSGTGVPLWTNGYNGPANGWDYAQAMAVDASGNVFVTGYSPGSGSAYDYATIGYSGAGVPLWTNRYNGPGNGSDYPNAMAVDASGNVIVTGYSPGSGSSYDYATIKYSGAGVPLWTNRYNGPANSDDYANAVAVDTGGNVIVTGYSLGSGSSYDYATIKYSGAGAPLWTNRYNGPANSDDYANAVVVDTSGNVIVTGYSLGSGGSYDYATIKYSGAGAPLWTNRYNGPANGDDLAGRSCLALGPDGSVFVTGSSDGNYTSGRRYDFATVKYISSAPLLAIAPDGGGGYFIRLAGVGGSTYRLQRATGLAGPWTSSGPQTAPASGVIQFWDLFPPPGWGFYRAVHP